MSQNPHVYGLIFEPKPGAPQAAADRGRFITFHATIADATNYYRDNRDRLTQTYADPIIVSEGKRDLPLHVVDQQATRGSIHSIASLRQQLAAAKTRGEPCLSAHHDVTAARPELYGNEYNKLIMQATSFKFIHMPEATRPSARTAKKVVRKPVAKPA